MDASIEKAKQQWQFVADTIPVLICLVDQDGLIIRSNRTLERWGLGTVATVRGKSLHQTLHPGCSAADCYLPRFERDALADVTLGRRTRLETFDPILDRHLAINVQRVIADDESLGLKEMLAVVSVDDTSELKRSEKNTLQLQETLRERIEQEMAKRIAVEDVQTRLLNILSQTPNFIAMAAPDGALLYLNKAGRTMLKLDEATDPGRLTMFECLTPEARQALLDDALPAALRKGVWTGASALQSRDGQRIPTTQVIIAHRRADGQAASFSIVEQDMSAWVQSETALRNSQDELRQLSAKLLNVQEDERRRIAADLHDEIGQTLSLIKLSIDEAARMIREGAAEEAGTALTGLSARVKDALGEVRRISMDLRPTTLDDLGILPTLSWFFREFEAACRHIKVDREISVAESDIPPALKTQIFRLLQEATTNIVKHSGADRIRVRLAHDDGRLQLIVADNGQGFDPHRRVDRDAQGLGLSSMKERARLSGGTFRLESTPGQGTSICASWPIVPSEGH